ncbi:hypothetical protein D3C84_499700 [compost metagenome]
MSERKQTYQELEQELEVWRHGPSCWSCGDSGDVHQLDGEWLGKCDCLAAQLIDVTAERDQLKAKLAELDVLDSDLYTCAGKGGRYEMLGLATGAGLTRGEDRLVYRDASTRRLFIRTETDFSDRMERLTAGEQPKADPCPGCGVPGFTASCDRCIPY